MNALFQKTVRRAGPSRPLAPALAVLSLILAAAPAVAQDLPSVGKSVKVGSGVYEIVYSHRTGDVYATSIGPRDADDGRIHVLDGVTLEEKASIPTPGYSPFGLGLHESSGTLYASDTRNGVVLAIDIASGSLTSVIENPADEGGHLREVVSDDAAGRVYVSSYADEGLIWVIDNETHEVIDTYMNVGDGTSGMVLDVPNNRMFAANMAGGDIVEIDLRSGDEVRRFSSGGERPTNLEYDAGRDRLWSANQASNDATVLDGTTGELIKAINVGDQGLGIRYNPVNDLIYVTARRSGIVTAVDAESLNVVTWMQTGSHPNTIAVNRDTGYAYVTNKARSAGRNAPPVVDPHGDTVTLLSR